MDQTPGLLTRVLAAIGILWLLWVALSIIGVVPGPLSLR